MKATRPTRTGATLSWGVLDQIVSSGSTFIFIVVAAKALNASEVGAISFAFELYLLGVFAARGVAGDPLTSRYSGLANDELRPHIRSSAAAAVQETGMSAVLGGDPDEVLAALDKHGLTPANINGAGQVVAAGTAEQLAALAAEPPAKARIRPLSVAGAFHTEHMGPAVDTLGRLARAVSTHDPRTAIISNADGRVVHHGADVISRIVRQVSAPVRWDLCMATMLDMGVEAIVELPPAGALTGLARRGMKGVRTVAVKTPDDLDTVRDLLA